MRFLWSLISTIALVFLFGACSFTEKQEKIRIGINSWPGYEFIYLAHVKSFFKQEGIDTQVIEFNSLGDARRAFERGQVDIVGTTVVELLMARYLSAKNPQAFFVTDYSAGADRILGVKGIKSIKDLRGKKVGVEIGTLTLAILARALEINGMSIKDVELVKIDPETMELMVEQKKVSAIVSYPPFSINIQNKFGAKVLFSSKEIPGEIVDILMADKSYIEKNKKNIIAVIKGLERARTYALTEGSDGMEIMARRERISAKDFKDTFDQGVSLVPLADQGRLYFGTDKFQKITEQTDLILRSAGMVTGEAKVLEAGVNWEELD